MPAPPGGLEQRVTAYVVDRAVGWGIVAGTAYVLWRLVVPAYGAAPGVGLALGTAGLVAGVDVVLVGVSGTSPGRRLAGLRVVDAADGRPIGVGRAASRAVVVGLAGAPVLGLGLLLLVVSLLADPEGRRRGWHDRVAGSLVVDVRAPREPERVAAAPPVPMLVNLTLLGLDDVGPGETDLGADPG